MTISRFNIFTDKEIDHLYAVLRPGRMLAEVTAELERRRRYYAKRVRPLGDYQQDFFTFRLYSDGSYKVYCTSDKSPGLADEGQATMGPVHADDVASYGELWFDDYRHLMDGAADEFRSATDHKGRP